jgi:hypothetical protein
MPEHHDRLLEGRALEKQLAREQDVRGMASGEKSPAQLKAENEAFAPLAHGARPDLHSAPSLG